MLPSDSAPSINGVVGSSLYISTAADYFICSSRGEKLNFTVRCVQKLQLLRASVAALLRYIFVAALSAATAGAQGSAKKMSHQARNPSRLQSGAPAFLSNHGLIHRTRRRLHRQVCGRLRTPSDALDAGKLRARDAAAAYCKLQRGRSITVIVISRTREPHHI